MEGGKGLVLTRGSDMACVPVSLFFFPMPMRFCHTRNQAGLEEELNPAICRGLKAFRSPWPMKPFCVVP